MQRVMEHDMSSESANAMANRECLSALADGELEDDHVARACALWRDEPTSRSTWHTYQLIGDVLRSDDLASDAGRDSAFVLALRARLATEPVVLAPMPAVASAAKSVQRRGWMAPAAAAAGFAAVAVVVVVLRSGDSAVPVAVSAPVPAAPALAQASAPTVITAPMIRDARLDRYLAAHQQFVGSSALGAQGFLRSATAEGAGR
jgi:sigma-E factor negative regulatory protein RseA